MIRMAILVGLALMFLLIHLEGNLNKYINIKYAYLSIIAIVLLLILFIFEIIRQYDLDRKKQKGAAASDEHSHAEHPAVECCCSHQEAHACDHEHEHDHGHDHGHNHTHAGRTKLSRAFTYAVLFFPVVTGIFLPIQTLDSSFIKAKGFTFPKINVSENNPGFHQFLKADMSVFYSDESYKEVSRKDLQDFQFLSDIQLADENYLKGLESIYNYPNLFVGRTINFTGFVYKGEQADPVHAFVFRYGFIHCVADSGVFGMQVEFPSNVTLKDDTWVEVSGKMALEFYQPFKQTIPVLKVTKWEEIEQPKEPYVYRNS
ncbi:TIGR03943 family putative permease subunit [Paenibacillus kobensis]|uniref:TIGR03943 family putative permease subunit n=1 Tax=Paenibacillus kobensis TaxID=59841 RepID=UPI000FD8C5FE|nr:TIGR03943 family protein [Paenibacillus kobensis]